MSRPNIIWGRTGIYKIVNTVTGECYVGSAVNLGARKLHHLHKLRKGKHFSPYLQRSFNVHGEGAFEFIVIEEVVKDRDVLFEREKYWVYTLKPRYNSNVVNPTRLGAVTSEETKQKLREYNLQPEVIAKKKAELTGQPRAPETIELIKAARAKQVVTEKMLKGLEAGQMLPAEQRKGMAGKKHSEATIQKMRETAEKRPPVSEETRRKQSEAALKRAELKKLSKANQAQAKE